MIPNLDSNKDELSKENKINTLDRLSEVLDVPKMKLNTIIELGELAETGKPKEVRKAEKKIEQIEEKIKMNLRCCDKQSLAPVY